MGILLAIAAYQNYPFLVQLAVVAGLILAVVLGFIVRYRLAKDKEKFTEWWEWVLVVFVMVIVAVPAP